MRFTKSAATTALGALAVVVTWGAAPQWAEAGPACNELGLDRPCIRSNDLRARLNLDEDGTDARLRLRNEDGDDAIELDAGTANVTNLFSNEEDESNGLVKAWAQINADGSVEACWLCDPAETGLAGGGGYEVDFTPLATDITGRPRSATIDVHITGFSDPGVISLADRSGDPSSVFVFTADSDGVESQRPFVLVIY
jgi:hypothetical protein